MLKPGNITVINSYNLRDSHQQIVGLYLLAMLHKRVLKGKEKIGVIFVLDEIQRLLHTIEITSRYRLHKTYNL